MKHDVYVIVRNARGQFLAMISDGVAHLPGAKLIDNETPSECAERIISELGVDAIDAPELLCAAKDGSLVYLGRCCGTVDRSSIRAGWSDINVGRWYEFCQQNGAVPIQNVEEAIRAFFGA